MALAACSQRRRPDCPAARPSDDPGRRFESPASPSWPTAAPWSPRSAAVWNLAAGGATVDVAGIPEVAYGGQGGCSTSRSPPICVQPRHLSDLCQPGPGGGGLRWPAPVWSRKRGAARRAQCNLATNAARAERPVWSDHRLSARRPLSLSERRRAPALHAGAGPRLQLGKILRHPRRPAGARQSGGPGATSVTIADPPRDTEAARNAPTRRVTLPGPNRPRRNLVERSPQYLRPRLRPRRTIVGNEMGPRREVS